MSIVLKKEASINILEAARIRIKNIFANGVKVYLSFSGGKDSLCIGHLVYELILKGEIDPKQLTVQFIDEEAIFPCVEKIVHDWRKKFILAGAKFEWYCLEVKHFNCFNKLSNDESFICWDREKQDVWVRQPPSIAIRTNPLLKARIDTYQEFLARYCMDGINMIGVRTSESLQRLQNMSVMKTSITADKKTFPIYDWTNSDVWLYLKNNNVDIPDAYIYLWQIGRNKNGLRISQFFSNDTAGVLVKMNEFYPELMERVIAREPNAYLAMLYWDSEMFGRSTKNRNVLEQDANNIDYTEKLIETFKNIKTLFTTEHSQYIAVRYKRAFIKMHQYANNKELKRMYESLMAGDPKLRTLRAITQDIHSKYIKQAEQDTKEGKHIGYI